MLQPFRSIAEMCLTHRLVLPKPKEDWRLVKEPKSGEILGLGRSGKFRGVGVATNGIIVAILREDEQVEFGHLDWFVEDKEESEKESSPRSVKHAVTPKRKERFAEFV